MDKRMGEYAGVWACFHQALAEDPNVKCSMSRGRPYFVLPLGEFCPYDEQRSVGPLPVWDSLAAYWYVVLRRAYWGEDAGVPEVSELFQQMRIRRGYRSQQKRDAYQELRFWEEKQWTSWLGVRSLLWSLWMEREYERYPLRWWGSGRIVGLLLERERSVCLRWFLETMFWGYGKGSSGVESVKAHMAWLSKASRRDIESLWPFFCDAFRLEDTEEPLHRMFQILSEDPHEDNPATMLRVLALHEDALVAEALNPFPSFDACVDWATASDIAAWVPARAGVLGEACLPALLQCADIPSENVRQVWVQALGEIGTIGVLRPLLGALRDPSDWVRLHAIEALSNLGALAKDATESLRQALAEEEGPLRDRLYALLQSLEGASFASFRLQLEELLFS